jgi:hypothetical protein
LRGWGKPVDVLVSGLRHALTAADGAMLGAGDFSMIEACVLLALAGQRDKCQLIAEGSITRATTSWSSCASSRARFSSSTLPRRMIIAWVSSTGIVTTMLFRAQERRLVEHPEDLDGEITVLKEARLPNALEIADFQLATWLVALGGSTGLDNPSDTHIGEAGWIATELAGLCDDDLFDRWMMIGDIVTGV